MNNGQIFELIKAGRTPFVIDAEKLQAKLHELSQRKIKPSIDVYSDYESDEAKTLKEKISRNWAYPLYKKVVSALTMWTHQDITIEKKYTSTEVDQVLLSAYEGESLEYFINEVFSLNLFNKFNDFIIVDKTDFEPVKPIIYTIPVTSVLYYETKGYNIQRLLYKIGSYKTENNEQREVYRYIGDYDNNGIIEVWSNIIETTSTKKDFWIVEEKSNRIQFNDNKTLNYIPVTQIGSLLYNEDSFYLKESRLSEIVDDLESYKNTRDIFEVSKVIHAFPEKISVSFDCPNCGGEGQLIDSEDNYYTCPKCKGEGVFVAKKPSDLLKVPLQISQDEKLTIPELVKYVDKDISTIDFLKKVLEDQEKAIYARGTGIDITSASGMKTATETVENRVPLNQKNNDIITSDAEPKYKWLYNTIGQLWYGQNLVDSVNIRKFYTGLSSTSILSEISTLKENEAPSVIKNELWEEYINAKWADNEKKKTELINNLKNQNNELQSN